MSCGTSDRSYGILCPARSSGGPDGDELLTVEQVAAELKVI